MVEENKVRKGDMSKRGAAQCGGGKSMISESVTYTG